MAVIRDPPCRPAHRPHESIAYHVIMLIAQAMAEYGMASALGGAIQSFMYQIQDGWENHVNLGIVAIGAVALWWFFLRSR
jgi:hypothetical protein